MMPRTMPPVPKHLHDARLQLLHGLGLVAVHGGAHLPLHEAVLVQGPLVLVQHTLLVPLTQVLGEQELEPARRKAPR